MNNIDQPILLSINIFLIFKCSKTNGVGSFICTRYVLQCLDVGFLNEYDIFFNLLISQFMIFYLVDRGIC